MHSVLLSFDHVPRFGCRTTKGFDQKTRYFGTLFPSRTSRLATLLQVPRRCWQSCDVSTRQSKQRFEVSVYSSAPEEVALEADVLGTKYPSVALVMRFLQEKAEGQHRTREAWIIDCAAITLALTFSATRGFGWTVLQSRSLSLHQRDWITSHVSLNDVNKGSITLQSPVVAGCMAQRGVANLMQDIQYRWPDLRLTIKTQHDNGHSQLGMSQQKSNCQMSDRSVVAGPGGSPGSPGCPGPPDPVPSITEINSPGVVRNSDQRSAIFTLHQGRHRAWIMHSRPVHEVHGHFAERCHRAENNYTTKLGGWRGQNVVNVDSGIHGVPARQCLQPGGSPAGQSRTCPVGHPCRKASWSCLQAAAMHRWLPGRHADALQSVCR